MDWKSKYLNKKKPQVGDKVKVIKMLYQDRQHPFKVGDIFIISKIESQSSYGDNTPCNLYPCNLYITENETKLMKEEFIII